jgi:UrcA family protein
MLRIHSTLAMTVAAVATIAFSGPAIAEEVIVKHRIEADIPRVEVRYGDLNLDNQAGRDRLTTRLDSAVREVCGNADYRDLSEFSQMKTCRVASTDRAYAARDALFAEHLAARERGETLALAGNGHSTLAVLAQR